MQYSLVLYYIISHLLLLYCSRHIQVTNNYSTMEVEKEEIEYKNETSHSLFLGFLLFYITLTNYYIIQDTFR